MGAGAFPWFLAYSLSPAAWSRQVGLTGPTVLDVSLVGDFPSARKTESKARALIWILCLT